MAVDKTISDLVPVQIRIPQGVWLAAKIKALRLGVSAQSYIATTLTNDLGGNRAIAAMLRPASERSIAANE